MKIITHALMLTGAVTFTDLMGPLYGAETVSPVKITSRANSDFCIDLYQQLATKNEGKNLFFSPFSISSALTMTAEGARGETLAEMAKVLCYPMSAITDGKNLGIEKIHQGFQQINGMLHQKQNDPKTAAIRLELTGLQDSLKVLQATSSKESDGGQRDSSKEFFDKEQSLVKRINELAPLVDQFELNVANAIWAEKSYSVANDFRATMARYYDASGLQAADFRHHPDAEQQRINAWVEKQTRDRIKDLIPPGILNETTRMVLVNAIYFKGEWENPFQPAKTKEMDFLLADGAKVKAQIMQADYMDNGRYGAFEADGTIFKTPAEVPADEKAKQPATYPANGGFAIAELPYKGKELSMVLIAPMNPDGLPTIEKQLSSANLDAWLGGLESREMNVKLPKFKLETDYQLGDSLQAMGMVRAFTDPTADNGADFTGIHPSDTLDERLLISQVIHKTILEVNEKGTEAAAATAVIMVEATAAYREVVTIPFIPTFNADRPFLLLIQHKPSGAILFMGRFTQP